MTGPRIDIEIIVDHARVDIVLEAITYALSPYPMANWLEQSVDPIFEERARRRFQTEGDAAVGGAWAALSPTTIEIRVQQGYGEGPINYRTGALEHYVTSGGKVTANVEGATLTIPGDSPDHEVELAFAVAQTGSQHAPARPVLGVGSNDLEAMLFSLSEHLTSVMAGVGLL